MKRKKLKYSIIVFCVILISCINAQGTDFLVSSVKEIKAAAKKAQPGDTLTMVDGIWTDANIIFEAKGTTENPVVLRASTLGKVILTGSSTLRIAGDYLVVDGLNFSKGKSPSGAVIEFRNGAKKVSNYSRLTNTAIVDYNPEDKDTDYKWVSLYGTHNRVDHCYFKNKIHSGCLLVVWLSEEPNYHLIDSNYFGPRPELGYNGGEIIRIGTSDWSMYDSYTTVEYNLFEECNGEREIISNKSFYNIYRYNTFVACQGALTLRHGNNCTVEGNFFLGKNIPMTGGVRIIGENHKVINNYFSDLQGSDVYSALSIMSGVPDSPLNRYFQVKNALIAFNTFINNKYNIVIGTGADDELSLPPINSTVSNNIFYGSTKPIITEISKPENFKWIGNFYFKGELGIANNEGFKKIDLKLQKDRQDIWKPSASSPVIGAAAGDYDFIKYDIDGQSRSNKKDVGCDQISDEVVKNRPLKSSDVGPLWLRFTSEDIK